MSQNSDDGCGCLSLIVFILAVWLFVLMFKSCDEDRTFPEVVGEEVRGIKEQFNKGYHKKDSIK